MTMDFEEEEMVAGSNFNQKCKDAAPNLGSEYFVERLCYAPKKKVLCKGFNCAKPSSQ